jgi:hypothetical protein
MRKKMATPSRTRSILRDKDLAYRLAKELKEHLQAKLQRTQNGVYYSSASTPEDYDGCWKQTRKFFSKKGLDYEPFIEILEKYSGSPFDCASDIANDLDLENLAGRMGINFQEEGELKK